MRFVSLLAAVALAAPAFAQLSVVAPNGYAATQGNTNNAYPWNRGTASMRCQFVYDSTNFTLQGITSPVLINRLRYRPATTTSAWAGGSWPNVRIDMATCPLDYSLVSSTYASNLGPDVTTVHQGQVVVQGGSGSGPNNWHIDIMLATPFVYDPGSGDLTIDVQLDGTGWTGTSTQADHVSGATALGSRIFNTTSATATTGTIGTSYVAVCEFGYSLGGSGTIATNTTLGQGCVRNFASFYELFPAPANFDLNNTGITMIPTGTGYVVTAGGTFLPVGSVQAVPTVLALGDDAAITQTFTTGTFVGPTGTWTGVNVISNGCVAQAAGNTTVAAPNVGTMLSAPQTGFYTQGDWDPVGGTGAGTILYEESASAVVITWDHVASWNNPGSQNTFQMQLFPSGLVTIAWQSMAAVGSNGGVLVGYSPGGPSANPGNTDISALGASVIYLSSPDVLPLALAGATRPITNTNWSLLVTNVPATGTIGLDIFGLADPGIIDLGFLGAPGCGVRSSLDVLNAWIVAGASHGYSLPIPNDPLLANFHVFTMALVLQPGVNQLLGGAITSNGIDGKIGTQ